MNQYLFMICPKSCPLDISYVKCESEHWNAHCHKEEISSSCINDFLKNSIILNGENFNPGIHSPCELFQALIGNPQWNVIVDGINCDLPDNLISTENVPLSFEN